MPSLYGLNPELQLSLEQDTILAFISVLEGVIKLAALEGFDSVVSKLEEVVEDLRSDLSSEEDEDVGTTGYE